MIPDGGISRVRLWEKLPSHDHNIQIQPLTIENFQPFGEVICCDGHDFFILMMHTPNATMRSSKLKLKAKQRQELVFSEILRPVCYLWKFQC
jgi:hypothetical protein